MNNKQKEHYGIRPSSLHKVVRIGAYHDDYHEKNLDVFCEVTYKDSRLSIHGVVAPKINGNCDGSYGQMYDSITKNLDTMVYATGWDKVKAFTFVDAWKKWHLNDMRPYCEHQKAEGYDKFPTVGLLGKHCNTCGYKYGTEWKHEDIPDSTLKFLEALPDTDKRPAWI